MPNGPGELLDDDVGVGDGDVECVGVGDVFAVFVGVGDVFAVGDDVGCGATYAGFGVTIAGVMGAVVWPLS